MTVPEFQRQKRAGKKLTLVTAYDALFTRIVEAAGIEAIWVGDSLGMVVQGKKDTLSVTMEEMLYHTRLVAGAAQRAFVIADMPFISLQVSVEVSVRNAGRFLQSGAAAVKVEGGESVADDRFFPLSQVAVDVSQIDVGVMETRIELGRLAQMVRCRFEVGGWILGFACPMECNRCAIIMGIGKFII